MVGGGGGGRVRGSWALSLEYGLMGGKWGGGGGCPTVEQEEGFQLQTS